jgi:hypothetical protein
MTRHLLVFAILFLSACADRSDPLPATVAAPLDRPVDGHLSDPSAARAAILIEAALADVRPEDLQRCLADFASTGAPDLRPPAHGGWLIVTSAQAVDGAADRRRQAVAPEPVDEPGDGWRDRVVYRALLRSADMADHSAACLSCVFDFEDGRIAFRNAYALETCHRAIPPERDLAIVMPVG